jgi:hypothetical protein
MRKLSSARSKSGKLRWRFPAVRSLERLRRRAIAFGVGSQRVSFNIVGRPVLATVHGRTVTTLDLEVQRLGAAIWALSAGRATSTRSASASTRTTYT